MSRKLWKSCKKCCRCGNKKTSQWYSCKCGNGSCTGCLCKGCYMKGYHKNHKDDIDSRDNIRKSMSKSRTGLLSRFTEAGKGFIGAQIVAKTYGLDDCNIKMNNFNFYMDISKHPEYGNIEVKTSSIDIEWNRWHFSNIDSNGFDTLILVCMDMYQPWKNVMRVYAIPCEEVGSITDITIQNSLSVGLKWERFRIDEKPFGYTYHRMDIKKCKVLRKDE